jgi:hypothetical protein
VGGAFWQLTKRLGQAVGKERARSHVFNVRLGDEEAM